LKRQGVDFHTAQNPDIKGAVNERFNRTLMTSMYKYFTKNNTYRYLGVINDLLGSYNSVHSTIGMPPSKVSPSNIYSVWRKVNRLRAKIPHGCVKFKVGYFVRITKQKVVFAKGSEQRFSTEIFRVINLFRACHKLFTNCGTCKIVVSKGNFTITNFLKSLYYPKLSFK